MRVYTVVEDDIGHLVEVEAAKQGMTRSSWIAEAITKRLRADQGGGDDLTKLKDDVTKLKDDLTKSEDDKDHLQAERDHLQDEVGHQEAIIKLKDDEIAFLRGHLSQISEKLPKALPPSQEEAKKKGWWQFWK